MSRMHKVSSFSKAYILLMIFSLISETGWCQFVDSNKHFTCTDRVFTSEVREIDLGALDRFARLNCEEPIKFDLADSPTTINYCEMSKLVSQYRELRKIISGEIGNTVKLSENWTLQDILSSAYSVRFVFSERDIVQDLLDYAVLRAALYQKAGTLYDLYKANPDYLNGGVCYLPRLRASLSGETLLSQYWNYSANQVCPKNVEGEELYMMANGMSCSDNRQFWMKSVKEAMAEGPIETTISINKEAAKVVEDEELALIDSFGIAYKLSTAYSEILNSKLTATKVLGWLNSPLRCGSMVTVDKTLKALEKFCFEVYETEVTPFDINDNDRAKLAVFAVVSTEMRGLKTRVDAVELPSELEFSTQPSDVDTKQASMIRQVGEMLDYFLEVHGNSFHPGTGE